jgi:orotate phosphoribosyltransferase
LKFGEFKLKSGRISPYFFNAGLFYDALALHQLGQFYAKTILQCNIKFNHLFGPAYKGLPLATAVAIAMASLGENPTVTFNRKEAKTHGEGGVLIGAPLSGDTLIIDDVITAGTAFRESQQLINENGGKLVGVVIALDRCERGLNEKSTVAEIKEQGIAVHSIINLFDLIQFLEEQNEPEKVKKLLAYQEMYGYQK